MSRTPADPPYGKTFIKQWRIHRGLTQVQLAEKMGISRSYFTMIEQGARRYDQTFLEKAAVVLGCTPADLIARKPEIKQRLNAVIDSMTDENRQRLEAAIRAFLEPLPGISQS